MAIENTYKMLDKLAPGMMSMGEIQIKNIVLTVDLDYGVNVNKMFEDGLV